MPLREELKYQAPRRLDAADAGFERAFAALAEESRETAAEVDQVVTEILATVRAGGDAALVDYTRKLDRFPATAESLRFSAAEIDAAVAEIPAKTRAALEQAAERITAFHRAQLPGDYDTVDAAGVKLGWRWRPIEAVGLYVPGGTASTGPRWATRARSGGRLPRTRRARRGSRCPWRAGWRPVSRR